MTGLCTQLPFCKLCPRLQSVAAQAPQDVPAQLRLPVPFGTEQVSEHVADDHGPTGWQDARPFARSVAKAVGVQYPVTI